MPMSTRRQYHIGVLPEKRRQCAKMPDPLWTHGNLHVFWLMQQSRVDAVDLYARLLQLAFNCLIRGPHCRLMPGYQHFQINVLRSIPSNNQLLFTDHLL